MTLPRTRSLARDRALDRPIEAACRVRCPCGGRLAPLPEGMVLDAVRTCTRCGSEWGATPIADHPTRRRLGVLLTLRRRGKRGPHLAVGESLCALLEAA